MIVKLTLGVWLISTLVFFYFFIFDNAKESEPPRGSERPPTGEPDREDEPAGGA